MPSKLKQQFFIFFVFLAISAVGLQVFMHSRVFTERFKEMAEDKVGSFFKAKVLIEDVKLGVLNRVSLQGLEIGDGSDASNPFRFEVDQITFRYDLFRILKQNLSQPKSIFLKAPKLVFRDVDFPYAVFQNLNFGSSKENISSLEFKGGKVEYVLTSLDSKINLSEIEGTLRPVGIGKFEIDILARAKGFISGGVRVRGEIDPIKKSHRLDIELEEAYVSKQFNLPIESATGIVRWVDGDLYFDEVAAKIHGWKTFIQGSLKNFEKKSESILILDLKVGKGDLAGYLGLKVDLKNEVVEGAVKPFQLRPLNFKGRIIQKNKGFYFQDVLFDTGYEGEGKLSFGSGDYAFKFEKGRQEVSIDSNLNSLDFFMKLHLDHAKFYGHDIVTHATIQLNEDKTKTLASGTQFIGSFKTDYFILNTLPLDDFAGTFDLKMTGLRNLESSWGENFYFHGGIDFRGQGPQGDFILDVENYPLEQAKELLTKPLRKAITGSLDGKLYIKGPLEEPDFQGDFIVKSGSVGRFDFNRAFVHFRGQLPTFSLYDSKVVKGRTTFNLKGNLDFSKDRFYRGVSIQTDEKIVLWKGWELNTSQEAGDIEIGKLLGNFPKLSLKAALDSGSTNEADKQEDQYLAIASKFQF